MTTFALRRQQIASSGTGVDSGGLDDNTPILDELLDVGAGVGVANFRLLSGVEPDFALADTSDGRGEPLLRAEIDHGW